MLHIITILNDPSVLLFNKKKKTERRHGSATAYKRVLYACYKHFENLDTSQTPPLNQMKFEFRNPMTNRFEKHARV